MYAATSPEAATLTSADADASVLPVAAVETVPLAQADPHAGAAEHGTATAEHGAEHGSGGLPQLDTQQRRLIYSETFELRDHRQLRI